MTEEQGAGWALSEGKDWKDDRHKRDNEHVREHAGQVRDRQTRETLSTIESVYERAYRRGWIDGEWPDSAKDTYLYQILRTHEETETFARRVEQEPEKLRAHVGSENEGIDVSGWKDIETIREIVTETHLRLYLYGEPGTGKTRSGCLVARHWLEQQQDDGHHNARILTNIRTLAEGRESIDWVKNWPELREEIDMTMTDILDEEADPFLFLFDEASSQASGSGKDGYEASTKLATLVYKIRKYGGALAIIGHDGKDLHPAVRELCKVLHKSDKKRARFYDSVRNREGKGPITPQITGWPDSKWKPNDKDPAPWDWSDEKESSNSDMEADDVLFNLSLWTVRECKSDGLSHRETAKYIPYSKSWVSGRWKEIQEGKHSKALDSIESEIN